MRKIIAILVMIGLVGGLFYYLTEVKFQPKDPVKNESIGLSEESILPEIKDHYDDFLLKVRKLQAKPDQLAELNCIITKILYSGKLSDDEIRLLVKFQREYFTQPTLDKNPEEANYERLIKELKYYKEADLSIIGYKIVGPQYVDSEDGKKDMLIFNVIYYLNITTDEGEVYKGYVYQRNDEGLWELKGFGAVESFPIIY